MCKLWRDKRVLVTLLLVLILSVPIVGWAKGEQSAYTARLEQGVMRGVVKASKQAVLYAQIQGRVSEVPFKEGQRFEKGSTLVQLDCDKYRAELAAAAAEQEAKDKTVEEILNEISDKGEFGWFVVSNASNNKEDGKVIIRKNTKGKERGYEAGKEPKGTFHFDPAPAERTFPTFLAKRPAFSPKAGR